MTYRQDTHDLETVAFLIQHLFVIKLSLECLQIVLNYLSNAVCKLCAVGNLLPRVVVCPDKNMCAAIDIPNRRIWGLTSHSKYSVLKKSFRDYFTEYT